MASVDKDQFQGLDIEERQVLKDLEDEIIDVLSVLDSTADTISSLAEMYKQFCRNSLAISQDVDDDEIDLISLSLQEKQRDIIQNQKRVKTLQAKIRGTANLVRFRFCLVLNFQRY